MSRKINKSQKDKLAAQGFMPAADAARLVGVDPSTVLRWIQDEKVEAIRVGPNWYIKRSSLAKSLGPDGAKALGVR